MKHKINISFVNYNGKNTNQYLRFSQTVCILFESANPKATCGVTKESILICYLGTDSTRYFL